MSRANWNGVVSGFATDPNGLNPNNGEGAADVSFHENTTNNDPHYSQGVTVMVSDGSPSTMIDGSALRPGALWWSPISGRLYIYFQDEDSTQWVPTNPGGVLTTKYGKDEIIKGDGGSFPDFISAFFLLCLQLPTCGSSH